MNSHALASALQCLHDQGALSDLDVHFAHFMERLAGGNAAELALAAALASHATAQGDICLNLRQWIRRTQALQADPAALPPTILPTAQDWLESLRNSPVVGQPGARQPLILDRRGRLYLYRYWQYEQRLARDLRRRASAPTLEVNQHRLRTDLAQLFPRHPELHGVDWQKVAAAVAALKRVCVISGGPGTGKTSTVLKVLALLAGQATHPLRIALAAPTGKAAARMQESIRAAKPTLNLSAVQAAQIPEQASTLHRLLGTRPNSVYFRHNAEHPLLLDVLVVDEVSMVGLALLAKTVDALLPTTRLILLGDKDQLASVDAGAVLGDLCAGAGRFSPAFQQHLAALTGETLPPGKQSTSPLVDSIVLLRHSYRFGANSGIGALAQAVNRGRASQASTLLSGHTDITWHDLASAEHLAQQLAAPIKQGFAPYLQAVHTAAAPAVVFAEFNRFRVLAVLRKGAFGVVALNQLCEAVLQAGAWITADDTWYAGRPIMVTRNDYNLRLFNGDIGITLPDHEQDGRMKVFFQGNDGELRSFPPARLPEHETVYAMTVHKSQGSEFEQVLVVTPDKSSPVLSRELIYTALTRAKQQAVFYGIPAVFAAAVERRLQRSSGLRDRLWVEPRLRQVVNEAKDAQ